jgi:hypothetical protein
MTALAKPAPVWPRQCRAFAFLARAWLMNAQP